MRAARRSNGSSGPLPTPCSSPQFYRAIHAEAERWLNAERRVLSFYDVQGHTDVEDYQRLLRYVESRRLAGLIFASPPFGLRDIGSPVVRLAGLPRVMIETGAGVDGCPTVYPDLSGFLPKAFDHLASRGCKRVAVVQMANRPDGSAALDVELAGITGMAAACGLTVEPQWIQWAPPQRRLL